MAIGAIEVEENPFSFLKPPSLPLEGAAHLSADDRKEWIEPAGLLDEGLEMRILAGREPRLPTPMLMQSQGCIDDEAAHRHAPEGIG